MGGGAAREGAHVLSAALELVACPARSLTVSVRRFLYRGVGLVPDERGQGTVEFALVTAGFLAVIIACGALWRVFEGGLFVEHALAAASHHVQGAAPGSLADVFLY